MVGGGINDEVVLEVNIVDGSIGGLDDFDDFNGMVCFGCVVFKVVVVVVFK